VSSLQLLGDLVTSIRPGVSNAGQALARTLGPHQAALMRAHGLLLVSESVRGLLVDAVHFKENARAHMQALQAGCRPLPLTADEMKLISHKEFRTSHVSKLWNYYVRKGVKDGVLPGAWPLLAAA
jgi:ribulose-5-phosphate 4-epimerase/fuculose-1-phosphate aldolase